MENSFIDSSKLSLSLRKKKMNQILYKKETSSVKESDFDKNKEESENFSELCNLSKILIEEKEVKKIINLLDKIYFFLINIKIPLKMNFVELSNIIPNLYQIIMDFQNNEFVISKIFDIFEKILNFFPVSDMNDKYRRMLNEQYYQIIYIIIEIHKNNKNILKKIFEFISQIIKKSNFVQKSLMIKPGYFFTLALMSLDLNDPFFYIQLLSSFSENISRGKNIKDFEILLIQKCSNILSIFYKEKFNDSKFIINNIKLFQNLYNCFVFASVSEFDEVFKYFFTENKENDINLYEKIIFFEKFDSEYLCELTLKIIGNIYCSANLTQIQNLIENNVDKFVMDKLLEEFNDINVTKMASWVMSNFVNNELNIKIFIEKKYIDDIIISIRKTNFYEVKLELLYIVSNLFYSIKETDILSFIDSDIVPCCIELLLNSKDLTLLIKSLQIMVLLISKGDPCDEVDYYKMRDDKIINPFKYQFDSYGLYDILSSIRESYKNSSIYNFINEILEHLYDKKNN